MRRAIVLLLLAALLQVACAEMDSGGRRSSVTDRAAMCAMCGASVSPDYFYYGSFKAVGPGNW
jgi:hypothetical protein